MATRNFETLERESRRTRSNGGDQHGYKLSILNDRSVTERTLRKFICVICQFFLRAPQQTPCGHRACTPCLEDYCSKTNPKCPGCSEEGEENVLSLEDCYVDKAIMRDMAKLDCVCINEYCPWDGKFPQYMVHERICDFSEDKKSDSESDSSDQSTDSEIDVLETVTSGIPAVARGFQFMFPVVNFKEKFNRAKDGISRAIYSESHVTGSPGYTVGACAYLNGDGMAKDRYMSLFFFLEKGDYDGKLKWPFNREVTLELVNQGGKKSVATTFKPDPTSTSFVHPEKGRNMPSGSPLFCKTSKLNDAEQGFVKDDKIMIRVTVGEDDICTYPEG